MLVLQVLASIGHLQAGHLQRKTFKAVKVLNNEVKIQCYQLKYC
jgi:hypothetical protein